jgi:hypothetical protein
MSLRLLSALASAFLVATPLAAQRLTGSVTAPAGAGGAAGVVIVASDSAGREVAHTVSLDDGRFAFFVDSTRALTFSAHRVGFQPTPVLTRQLRDGETETVTVALGAEPVALPRNVPRKATTCGGGSAEGRAAVATLLGEARKAMLAARFRVGRTEVSQRFTTVQHRTAKNGEDTLYTFMRRNEGTAPVLFDETPAEELERRGFFATILGERVFAPVGLETMLSDWFATTHCFTLQRVTPEEIVMAYEPTRERKGLVDVQGSYVFDRTTGGLKRTSFEYVNLPAEERKSGAGGLVEFARSPNGNWLALHWLQRFPLLGYRTASGNTSFVQSSMTLIDIIGHRVVGGRVNAVVAERGPVFRHDPVPTGRTPTPFQAACPERLVTAQTSAATGKLVANDSLGVDRVLVRAMWKVLVVVDRTQMAEREHVRETATGPDGEWTMCDLPVDRDIEVTWSLRGKEQKRPLKIAQGGIMVALPE